MGNQDDIDSVLGKAASGRLLPTLQHLAWRKWRIPGDTVEDLLQSALLTFLEVRSRYPKREEHVPILVGIFRNKCREHIDQSARTNRVREALRSRSRAPGNGITAVRSEETLHGGVLGEIVRLEEGRQILGALGRMRPEAREIFRLITEEGVTRKQLLKRLGLNANTLDTRLHSYRKQLKSLLAKEGAGLEGPGRHRMALR